MKLKLSFCLNQSAPKIFGGPVKVHNLLFISKDDAEFSNVHVAFSEAAKAFKGEVSTLSLQVTIEASVKDSRHYW